MIPLNIWEHQSVVKALYAECIGPICGQHQVTRMEIDILLFLANNPRFDTATDMIEMRYLSKSQVSASVKALVQRGFLRKEYADNNRKSAHLKICQPAETIIQDGQKAQEQFLDIILDGFSADEISVMKQYNDRIWHNINVFLREDTSC